MDLLKFYAAAYNEGQYVQPLGQRFTVRAKSEAQAIRYAKQAARELGCSRVFVETMRGEQVYDGEAR